jgi:hypothetical protein
MSKHWFTPARGGLLLALCCAALPGGAPEPALARPWNPDPAALARDYSIINDTRPNHDMRMVFWLTPPVMNNPSAKEILDKYVILGVASGHVSSTATMSFDPVESLHPTSGDGKPLKFLTADDIPPTVNGMVATMTSALSQSLGFFGKGFHWFVFEGGSVHACQPGGLMVPLAGVIYTYKTPIPGCTGQEQG